MTPCAGLDRPAWPGACITDPHVYWDWGTVQEFLSKNSCPRITVQEFVSKNYCPRGDPGAEMGAGSTKNAKVSICKSLCKTGDGPDLDTATCLQRVDPESDIIRILSILSSHFDCCISFYHGLEL